MQTYFREVQLDVPSEGDRIPCVLSSETPVDRGDFVEILDHGAPGSVDLARAPLPLITSHDGRQLPIGTVEDVRLDTEGRVLRAAVRFGSSETAKQISRDVQARVVRSLSVGYQLTRCLEQIGNVARWAWQPFEVSIVSIPADPNAGFFRHKEIIIMEQQSDNTPEPMNDAARVRAIVDMGAQYAKYLGPNDVASAVQSGESLPRFQERVMRALESRHTDTSHRVDQVDWNRREASRYSLARAVLATVTNDWTHAGLERETSQELARKSGRAAEGLFVPTNYWGQRDFNVGTSTEAGNLVATDLRTDLYVDALRAAMVMAGMGVRILPGLSGNVDIPRKAVAGTLGMLTEIGSASETNPQTAKLTLSPKRVSAYTEFSKQALIQSAMALEGMLRDDLVQGAAVLLEYQMINGAGTAGQILGLRSVSGIGTVAAGTNGLAPTWQHFLDLEAACGNANANSGPLAGYLLNSKTRAKAKGIQRGTSLDFIIPGDVRAAADGSLTLNGYRTMFSNNILSNLTKGTSTTICSAGLFSSDWSMVVLGLFGAPDVVVDPYSLASTGQVRITINQFADAGLRQPATVAKIEDWLA